MPDDSAHDDSVPSGIGSLLSSLDSLTDSDSSVKKVGSSKLVLDTPIEPSSSSSTSGTWGAFEEMRPLAQSPEVKSANADGGGIRPMIGSPMATDDNNVKWVSPDGKQMHHGQKHFTSSFPNNVPVSWTPAGMSVNVLFPAFSKSKPVQDVYTQEPPAAKHKEKHVNGKVKVPLNITLGQGVTAQTVGPMNVNVFASVA